MSTILLTGFPGFLGSALLPLILARRPDSEALCIVQAAWARVAAERLDQLCLEHPDLADRVSLREGDITRSGLGLDLSPGELAMVSEVFHLAAVYDLSVARSLAETVNVGGTRNVLEVARQAPNLKRFQYVSTCYVGGDTSGWFTEVQLERGQAFNNHYEETKYRAEVEVRQAMASGLPGTIYRPSVVVGDSRTGETQKFDGPYFVIRWILKQSRIAVLPVAGNPAAHRLNVVPRDFVIRAMAHLSALPGSLGKTYHLADPDPPTVDQLITAIGEVTGRRIVRVPLPETVAVGALRWVPGLSRFMGIPADAVPYFTHPTLYDMQNSQADLEGAGIPIPSLLDILPVLVDYVKAHPEVRSDAMV